VSASAKPGDAKADHMRDEFAANRAARREALGSPHDADAEDTQRLQAVLADSQSPKATRGVVGFLAAFPKEQRLVAFVVLVVLVLGLVALGGAKWLGLV